MIKVIFFIRGLPTEDQKRAAGAMQAVIRDPDKVGGPGDFIEQCEYVCGDIIPEPYKDKPQVDYRKASQYEASNEIVTKGFSQVDNYDFEAMSADELVHFAEHNKLTFPKSVDTRKEMVGYLKKWAAKN
ncbi:hypothetical protein C4J81_13765 [Deltaproteobacteria bacterium Smac51]|nr:hypothetical protein C4J81_13765 [Deltaproteobacteria bacterium Smac51]